MYAPASAPRAVRDGLPAFLADTFGCAVVAAFGGGLLRDKEDTVTASTAIATAAAPRGPVAALCGALARRAAAARAARELSRLDDRMLRDIGISRCDIESVVRGTYGSAEGL